jgi:hypothetical protein
MPDEVVFLTFTSIVATTSVVIYGLKYWARRRMPGSAEMPRQLDQRLERIEQAVDAMAIEVERISEGQRFTTKLLSDRSESPGAAARRPD